MRKPRQSESDGQFCFWCNLPTHRRVFHLWWRWKFTSSFWEALEGNLCPNVLAMHKTSTFTPLFNCMYTYQWHTTPFLVSLDNLTLVLGKPGPIHMRRQVRANKTKALVDEVEMLQANPYYAHVRYPDSRKTTDGHQETCTSGPNQIVTTSWHALQATENTSQVEDSTETRMNLPVRRSERVCGSVVSLDLWRGRCCMP